MQTEDTGWPDKNLKDFLRRLGQAKKKGAGVRLSPVEARSLAFYLQESIDNKQVML